MGVVNLVMGMIHRVRLGERPEDVEEEQDEDPFLARSLQIDEDIRTGKNRMLTAEETRRFFDRVKRRSGGNG